MNILFVLSGLIIILGGITGNFIIIKIGGCCIMSAFITANILYKPGEEK